jgi:hypothetical protein
MRDQWLTDGSTHPTRATRTSEIDAPDMLAAVKDKPFGWQKKPSLTATPPSAQWLCRSGRKDGLGRID